MIDDERWTVGESASVRGEVFYDGEHLSRESFASYFEDIDSFQSFLAACAALNGFFAVTITRGSRRYAAVDRGRTIPLYYTVDGSGQISDSAQDLVGDVDVSEYDPFATSELLTSMHVTGPDTLVRDVKGLQAGEAMKIRDRSGGSSIKTTTYTEYSPPMNGERDEEILQSEFDDVILSSAKRLSRVADGRTIAVPLSGGYDSRLVVLSLVAIGHDDILTFSYGDRDSNESRVSRRIAADLDLPWEFVEYTPERWREWYENDGERFYCQSFDYDCIVNDGFAPALAEMLRNDTIPKDTVVVPGQSVATMSEHFPKTEVSRSQFAADGSFTVDSDPVDYIIDRWFDLWRWRDERFESYIRSKISNQLDIGGSRDPERAVRAYETWEWRERQSKYINRDARQHEFYELDWWYPLWDEEFVSFWGTVPLRHRRDKGLYRRYVNRKYTELTGASDMPALPTESSFLTSHIYGRLSRSVIGPLLRELYWRFRQRWSQPDLPFSRQGVLPRELFEQYYTGREKIQSFQALEAAGRLSRDPPRIRDPPTAGFLRLPTESVDEDPDEPVVESGN